MMHKLLASLFTLAFLVGFSSSAIADEGYEGKAEVMEKVPEGADKDASDPEKSTGLLEGTGKATGAFVKFFTNPQDEDHDYDHDDHDDHDDDHDDHDDDDYHDHGDDHDDEGDE